jgi:hypothetical protein
MEGLAGLGAVFALVSIIGGLLAFLMILSIAIDSGRLIRRANRLIDLVEQQNRYLAAISTNIAMASTREEKSRSGGL